MKIALIGECMLELQGKAFGDMVQSYGGDTLNTAVYLSRTTNNEVYYVTVVGADALSNQMVCNWEAEGISTNLVLVDHSRNSGLYMIHLDPHGERSFSYWRENSAAKYLCQHPEYQRVVEALEDMDVVYLSGISLAVLPLTDRQVLLASLFILHSKGVKIVFDTNYRPSLWDCESDAMDAYSSLFHMADYALVTNDDESALWGDASEDETLARLQVGGVKHAVVKTGAKGCLSADLSKSKLSVSAIPASKVEKVIDTTSAGDSFNAGFIAGLSVGQTPEISCEYGHQLAGIVIQHKGAIIPESLTNHLKWTE